MTSLFLVDRSARYGMPLPLLGQSIQLPRQYICYQCIQLNYKCLSHLTNLYVYDIHIYKYTFYLLHGGHFHIEDIFDLYKLNLHIQLLFLQVWLYILYIVLIYRKTMYADQDCFYDLFLSLSECFLIALILLLLLYVSLLY